MVVNLRTGVLSDMWVEEAFRRKGVAHRLVQFAQEQARDRKFDKVRLQVYVGNDAARNLYEKSGFEKALFIMDWDCRDPS